MITENKRYTAIYVDVKNTVCTKIHYDIILNLYRDFDFDPLVKRVHVVCGPVALWLLSRQSPYNAGGSGF